MNKISQEQIRQAVEKMPLSDRLLRAYRQNDDVLFDSALKEVEFYKNVAYRLVRTLAWKKKRTPKNRQRQLWAMVAEVTDHGSGYSIRICRDCGYDPDTGELLEIINVH